MTLHNRVGAVAERWWFDNLRRVQFAVRGRRMLGDRDGLIFGLAGIDALCRYRTRRGERRR